MDKLQRMRELVLTLGHANYMYEHENQEVMTNFEYDKLYDELLALESELGVVMAGSVTNKVGLQVCSQLEKVSHATPMLSLDKTKDIDKLESFLDDKVGVLSWKLDGLTLICTYENGELTQAVTRGNGSIGEDVTHNVKTFKNLPHKISYKGKLVIRGEAIIPFAEFERINLALDDKYKNPRNLCSGTVRQLNSAVVASRHVKFIAFAILDKVEPIGSNASESRINNIDVTLAPTNDSVANTLTTNNIEATLASTNNSVGSPSTDNNIEATAQVADSNSKSHNLDWLAQQGFEVVQHKTVTSQNVAEEVEHFKQNIETQEFGSDGLVLTYDEIAYSKSLGATSKFPKDSIAFKWTDELKETTIKEIQWNTSRTGLINPVAVFEPVDLEGTSVERASIHNISILEQLQLGIGDTILVYKANMIIPQIAENLTCSGPVEIPTTCNVCGSQTTVKQQHLYCLNVNCSAQQLNSFVHFVSRNAMNISGLSKGTLLRLLENNIITDLNSLYHLANYKEQIVELSGFGERSYTRLMNAIDKSRIVELPQFIYALGIIHVGTSTAKLICQHFGYDFDKIRSATLEELVAIDGIGPITAEKVFEYFNFADNKVLIDNLLTEIKFETPPPDSAPDAIAGKVFVVTGDVEHFKNRKELQALIESRGGKVTGSVSKNTDYLINNDNKSTSNKNKKAIELNIPIITEEEFLQL